MKVVHSDDCLLHNPQHEILSGKQLSYLESPARYIAIRDALRQPASTNTLFEFIAASEKLSYSELEKSILSVHSEDYVNYLRSAYEDWVKGGGDKAGVFPDTFLHSNLAHFKGCDVTRLSPIAKSGEPWLLIYDVLIWGGNYRLSTQRIYWSPYYGSSLQLLTSRQESIGKNTTVDPNVGELQLISISSSFDLSTPITGDTFQSAVSAVRVALTACEVLLEQLPIGYDGTASAAVGSPIGVFALTRPPGHHATSALCGGYCYLNNVAIATRFLQTHGSSRSRAKATPRVAILDIDYHHGNGTQAIFYDDSSVFYVSLHAAHDYPYFTGTADERGTGQGTGFNLNIPLPISTGDAEYLAALQGATNQIRIYDPLYLIISLGVDTFECDPICEFGLTANGYSHIGEAISAIEKPTVFVMEGGYDLGTIGLNVRAVLDGFIINCDHAGSTD